MSPRSAVPARPGLAFTLIELLIVVAIIAILAAIAVPNFLEAQTRAKVTAARANMRSLATAVESYFVDNNDYPIRRNVIDAPLEPCVPEVGNRLQQMGLMTTPIAYITALPADPFEKIINPPNNVIDYWDPTQAIWMINCRFVANSPKRIKTYDIGYLLISMGPDAYLGPVNTLYGWPKPDDPSLSILGTMWRNYDPTNGVTSRGNIYSGPGGPDSTVSKLQDFFNR